MSRAALNLTLTTPLIRANLRQRLDALAARTDLPPTSIAGRALLVGLAQVEGNLSLLLTGAAVPTIAQYAPTTPAIASAVHSDGQQCAAQAAMSTAEPRTMEATSSTRADTASTIEDSPSTAEHSPTSPTAAKTPTEPRAEQSGRVTAKVAAAALGYRAVGVFHSFVFRHKELRRYSREIDGAVLWDLDGLRREYERQGWAAR